MNVHLLRRNKKLSNGKRSIYRLLQWTDARTGKVVTESLGKVTQGQAEELRRSKIAMFESGIVPASRRDGATLSQFRVLYLEQRASEGKTGGKRHKTYPKLSVTTLREHDMLLRYLVAHFGEYRQLETVTEMEAESFLDRLECGDLESARKASKRKYGLGEQTIRKHIRTARAVWSWAQHYGMVTANPFSAFHASPLATQPGHHVSLDELDQVLSPDAAVHGPRRAAPPPDWQCMFGLCRLAGLRREEARTLPWAGKAIDHLGECRNVGIDWGSRKLRLVSTKNAHYRVVPIVGRLYDILVAAYDKAPAGRESITGLSRHNLERYGHKHVTAAGLTPWPKFYQAMRVSREDSWKEQGIAEATYAEWMGHSVTISRKHYTSSTEAEYATAINAT